MSKDTMKSLPLTPIQEEQGAKMGEFAGYKMPLYFSSPKEEVLAVRNKAGVFDVSHMGEFFVEGPQTTDFLNYLVPNDYRSLSQGKALYSPLLNKEGKILDDLILYKLSQDKALVCVNASNIEKDYNWFLQVSKNFDCNLFNASNDFGLLALQGPNSQVCLEKVLQAELGEIPYYGVVELDALGAKIILARTGYTGEDGFEVFCPKELTTELYQRLLDQDVTPCGLVARDVLRLEVGFPLYGQDLSEELTPYDAGLKWTVKINDSDFLGKKSLIETPSQFMPIKIITEKGVPRPGMKVLNSNGEEVGNITSGTHSVILGKGIALASILRDKNLSENFTLRTELPNGKFRDIQGTRTKQAFVKGGHK